MMVKLNIRVLAIQANNNMSSKRSSSVLIRSWIRGMYIPMPRQYIYASIRQRQKKRPCNHEQKKMFALTVAGRHRMIINGPLSFPLRKRLLLLHLPGAIHIPNMGANGGRSGLINLIVPARTLN